MKKFAMLFAVALTCTTVAFAAEDAAPQDEQFLQAPQIAVQQQAAQDSVPTEENAVVTLPEAPAQTETPATPSETLVDEDMLVTPELPAEGEPAAPAVPSEIPVDEEMLVTPEAPAEEEAEPEEQLPAEGEPAAPAVPSETPVDDEMLVTPEGEATAPEAPAEEEIAAPEEQLPAEEEQIIVEIPENEIPVAAAPVTITIRGIVYDGEEIAYDEEQTIETAVGETLDLNAYVWTETPGIELACGAGEVTVSADTTEYVLTYKLLEGWVIL